MKNTNSKAHQIRKYIAANPNAKPKQIAETLGTGLQYVYTVMHNLKKKAIANKKAAIKKAVKGEWKTLTVTSSNTPMQVEMFEPAPDAVNHPAHYKVGGIETIDFIEAKKLNYNIGNVIKYLTRADYKGNKLEDLRKAQWYLTREISTLK
jgi:hypothetical protein